MQRMVEYRGFEIHVELVSTSKDTFDVWFRIEGATKPPGVAAIGERIKVRGGPFSRRWAYLVAEIVGQAAIDVILGVTEEKLIAEPSDARGELAARLGSNAFAAARDSSQKTSVEMDMAKGKEVFASHKGFVIRVLVVPEYSPHPPGVPFGYVGYVARPEADIRVAGQRMNFSHPVAEYLSAEAAEQAGIVEGRSIIDGIHPDGLTTDGL